ncbi:MAG: DUF1800 domain-containing protein [Nitrospiraceae bacterium]|nr:DUF1800 domain-containing protein [Nitrospiraceae bacterium]
MPLSFDEARHLLSRTGFGATPDEIRRLMPLDRAAAVAHILAVPSTKAHTPPPTWIHRLPPLPRDRKYWSEMDKRAFREERKLEGLELKGWWYRELRATKSPILERMTLFWHNHFTSSLHKVKWPGFLYWQNVLLRLHALGSFGDMLKAIAKNPAMVLYLDTQTNRKDHPNENFSRELFELFTLGEGHYTERDIKEAARAFSGWHVDHRTGAFRVDPIQHDDGRKLVFGKSGAFEGDDILALTLDDPQTARHLVVKLWREFVSEEPAAAEVERLATLFTQERYEITPVLRAIFLNERFWIPEERGAMIKSPVELMVGTAKLFGLPDDDPLPFIRYGRRLGQDLFDPPNVKGWPGGARWITATTLLVRTQLLHRSIRGHELGHPMTMGELGHGIGSTWQAVEPIDVVQATLLPLPPVSPLSADEERAQSVVHLVTDPVYQLK